MQLEEADLMGPVKKTLELYLSRQSGDGHYDSQGQFDGNGQAQWVLWQFYKISADRDFLARVYPAMRRAADWTNRIRRQNPPDSPFAGLLTSDSFNDGENYLDSHRHIVGFDFWNLRGMLCTADAARLLGRATEAAELQKESVDYRQAIETAWTRLGVPHFPPAWEKELLDLTKNPGTHWGNTETLWPTELFAPNDPRVTALIDEVRHKHGGGFAEGLIRWTGFLYFKNPHGFGPGWDLIHQYMSTYTTMASLARGESEQVVEDFYWFLLHSTASNAFAEGIEYKKRTACYDVLPHGVGAAMCTLMLRHMILDERGDELHLLSAVPDGNATEAREAALANAADAPVDGAEDAWIKIAPYGTYRGSKPGRPQHFTEAEANAMVAEFNSLRGKAGRLFRGIPIYIGQPHHPGRQDGRPVAEYATDLGQDHAVQRPRGGSGDGQ